MKLLDTVYALTVEDVCKKTGLIPEEVDILFHNGCINARKNADGEIYYRSDDLEDDIAKFDKILVKSSGVFKHEEAPVEVEDAICATKSIGWDFHTGEPIWRLSDVLEYRKSHPLS